ncbi:hypothetical protein Droror1_Dr00027493 [Drosera rotundifolia]
MGAETEETEETEESSTLTLPIFSLQPPRATTGTAPSPLHTAASVPFRWEEQPGKPRPCTTLSHPTNTGVPKCLELPPRLLYIESSKSKNKTPSPTTVLEGPDHGARSIFQSYSFRFTRGKTAAQEETNEGGGGSGGSSPERGLLGGPLVLSRRVSCRDGGLLGSLRRRAFSFRTKREVTDVGNFVFLDREGDGDGCGSDGDGCTLEEMEKTAVTVTSVTSVRRKRSPLGLSEARSNFWATIYGALKQVIPRRTNKDSHRLN